MHTRQEQLQAFDRLLTIMDELREKCPWDRKQTFESLRQNTIEEANELSAAIIRQDYNEISKELGDVLLHVVFYAKMGSEKGEFDMADVCNRLSDKLVFRHPHVYGDEAAKNAEDVSRLWEQVKLKEKGGNKTVLEGIPDSLPSLVKAYRIQDKVANVGFDWEKREDVWDKVKEEIAEFEQEIINENENENVNDNENENVNDNENENVNDNENENVNDNDNDNGNGTGNRDKQEKELGDVLFALVNAARLYKLKPDNALEKTNQKFIRRFNYIEQTAAEQGRQLKDMTLAEMESIWQESKTIVG